ncbi:glutamate-cysteine ligase family protein [Streptomyces albus]|uniref:glutamate-cysteine ligase family protein n=1 Tax=Streptomyces albus TaxID=1888 RepID=UPI003F1C3BD4
MASAPDSPSLTRADLRSVFESSFSPHARAGAARELVGIEVETAALDPHTGAAVPYEGPAGLRALLEHLVRGETGAVPVYDRSALTGVTLPEGGTVTLEHGGAVEYSSPPCDGVAELARVADGALRRLAAVARRFGFALVPGGQYPFTAPADVAWVPHSRMPAMRRHFMSLGPSGADGVQVMSLALSTQTSLDFTGPEDLTRKLRALAAASTPAAALFVNAPLEGGRPCGLLSRRMDHLSRTDPARTGAVPVMLAADVDADRLVDWALDLPMIHRAAGDGGRRPAPAVPFRTLLTRGFGDGTRPGPADWRAHLSQVFTDVRVRETLELRAVDGPPYRALFSVPAFWTGLAYRAAQADTARRGLAARIAGRPVRELATALLDLSAAGLAARVAAGTEHPEALSFLEPLREVAATGVTFAERLLADRAARPAGFPARHIAHHRIP